MTDAQKLDIIKTLIDDGTGYMPSDNLLNTYIAVAGNEILSWMYHLVGGVPEDVTDVPSRYDGTHIYAVVVGFTQSGAEGQGQSIENGVHRNFRYSDMLDYIHNNVLPFVRVGAVT
jgi:hypothetical protein